MASIRESQVPLKLDRTPMEFSSETKLEALRRAKFRCECCGKSKEELKEAGEANYFEIHHILPLFIIDREFPELSLVAIKSLENARVLCKPCHLKVHHDGTMTQYIEHAQKLKEYQERIEKQRQL